MATSVIGPVGNIRKDVITTNVSTGALDSFTETGIYHAYFYMNSPTSPTWGLLIVVKDSVNTATIIEQVLITIYTVAVRHKEGSNNWTSWTKVSLT